MNDRIKRIQTLLREFELPAWLFYDFRGSDPIAYRVLGLDPDGHSTRRWFYLIPSEGEPVRLVHRIESGALDPLPGTKLVYLTWQELRTGLSRMLESRSRVAMQYSPLNAIPYFSLVDAGTADLIRSLGPEIVSSGDLIQRFESVWSKEQIALHKKAALRVTEIVQEAFSEAHRQIRTSGSISEFELQTWMMSQLEASGLVTDFPPIVAVNANSSDPHYHPKRESSSAIRPGDFLLIDLWAKAKDPGAVFADITWTGVFGPPPAEVRKVFEAVKRARDAGVQILAERRGSGERIEGWEVDAAVRRVIIEAGYGDAFVHRTGHNLGEAVHGNGVNFDNLETRDTREVISGIGCTIEPGVYLPPFGVRSELDVFIQEVGVEVTTPPQNELIVLN
jgi:Xaa-Pro dipeptidase